MHQERPKTRYANPCSTIDFINNTLIVHVRRTQSVNIVRIVIHTFNGIHMLAGCCYFKFSFHISVPIFSSFVRRLTSTSRALTLCLDKIQNMGARKTKRKIIKKIDFIFFSLFFLFMFE